MAGCGNGSGRASSSWEGQACLDAQQAEQVGRSCSCCGKGSLRFLLGLMVSTRKHDEVALRYDVELVWISKGHRDIASVVLCLEGA
jgi:hypothetical protein